MVVAARNALDEINAHSHAKEAIAMLDCHLGNREYVAPPNPNLMSGCARLKLKEVLQALRGESGSKVCDRYVYQCFDWLFYYLDRIGYLLAQGFIQTDDVADPLAPYVSVLRDNENDFEPILRIHCYSSVSSLLAAIAERKKTSPTGSVCDKAVRFAASLISRRNA